MNKLAGWLLSCYLVTATCQAVTLSPTGMGQVLIFPYYTTRALPDGSAFNTLFSITNTVATGGVIPDAKVIRIRLLEARAGTPVFEVNVFLGPTDTWTAAIVPRPGGGAGISTPDASCTVPTMRSGTVDVPGPLLTLDASRLQADTFGNDATRVQEGFIEVLELGAIPRGTLGSLYDQIAYAGAPARCGPLDPQFVSDNLSSPSGGLYGSATLIDVAAGTAYGYDAVALDGWRGLPMYTPPGDPLPTLASASPPVSAVIAQGKQYVSWWPSGLDAVNAALMVERVYGDYMIEPAVGGATDWIMTMPTRRLNVTSSGTSAPFTNLNGCEPQSGSAMFDRDQRISPNPHADLLFYDTAFCGSVSVLPIHPPIDPNVRSQALGALTLVQDFFNSSPTNRTLQWSGATIFPHGSGTLSFIRSGNAKLTSAITTALDLQTGIASGTTTSTTYHGLPVLGLGVIRYVNGQLNVNGRNVLANYGASTTLRRVLTVTVP